MNTTVTIEEIILMNKQDKRKNEINKLDLLNIVFTENGKIIKINEQLLIDYKFTGLNNIACLQEIIMIDKPTRPQTKYDRSIIHTRQRPESNPPLFKRTYKILQEKN